MRKWLFGWICVVLAAAGCSTSGRTNVFCPGTADFQQRRAERFDPYAQRETGPEIVGARPREYQVPVAEPARARWTPWAAGR